MVTHHYSTSELSGTSTLNSLISTNDGWKSNTHRNMHFASSLFAKMARRCKATNQRKLLVRTRAAAHPFGQFGPPIQCRLCKDISDLCTIGCGSSLFPLHVNEKNTLVISGVVSEIPYASFDDVTSISEYRFVLLQPQTA